MPRTPPKDINEMPLYENCVILIKLKKFLILQISENISKAY